MFSVKFNSFEAALIASKTWLNMGYYSVMQQIGPSQWGLTLRKM